MNRFRLLSKNIPYWREYNSERKSWAKVPSEFDSKYHPNLRILEFDEQGDAWERQQRVEIERLIDTSPPNSTVIVFTHGWQNNADPKRSPNDLERFNKFLYSFPTNNTPIIGIYVAWRGRSVNEAFPLSKYLDKLSFPFRRAATNRVASIALSECLWKIRHRSNLKTNRVILIGHSFGGRILERVLSPSILNYHVRVFSDDPAMAEQRKRRESLAGDLIILVNPASEALHARQMRFATGSWGSAEPPAIISLTSETDIATRTVWKVGKFFERVVASTVPKSDRNYALGHHKNPNSSLPPEKQSSYLNSTAGHNQHLINGRIGWSAGELKFETVDTDSHIQHRITTGCYPVFTLPKEILDGHSGKPETGGIFNANMSNLLESLFIQTRPENYSSSKLSKFLIDYKSQHD